MTTGTADATLDPEMPRQWQVTFGAVDGLVAYDGLWDQRVTAWLLEAVRSVPLGVPSLRLRPGLTTRKPRTVKATQAMRIRGVRG